MRKGSITDNMLYINQNDYPDIKYPTNASDKTSKSYLEGTIESSGCGLCSLCMVVDRLTLKKLELIECRDLSLKHEANLKVGTNMKVLGPVVAQMFDLSYKQSSDENALAECLKNGGAAIINVGGDHDDHIGVFSDVGHYITAIGFDDNKVKILDPAYRKGKYDIEGREGKVIDKEGILFTTLDVLHDDTNNRTPRYYLFNNEV